MEWSRPVAACVAHEKGTDLSVQSGKGDVICKSTVLPVQRSLCVAKWGICRAKVRNYRFVNVVNWIYLSFGLDLLMHKLVPDRLGHGLGPNKLEGSARKGKHLVLLS